MINKEDIRKGNIFLFSGNSEGLFDYEDVLGVLELNDDYGFYVYLSGMSNEMLSVFSEDQIKPVPLTDRMLRQCGFDSDSVSHWLEYSVNGVVNYLQLGHYSTGKIKHLPDGKIDCPGIEISWLHQLQNLVFAITGEGLYLTLANNKNDKKNTEVLNPKKGKG